MLYLIGAGPGNPKYLCQRALELIQSADLVLAFERIAADLYTVRQDIITVSRVYEIKEYLQNGGTTVLLASGDPVFFGIGELLKREKIMIAEIIPGISSVQYLAAKVQISWQDALLLSCHGRDDDFSQILSSKKVFILTDSTNTPAVISQKLYRLGKRGKITVGANLSYENESIATYQLGEEITINNKLSVILVEDE